MLQLWNKLDQIDPQAIQQLGQGLQQLQCLLENILLELQAQNRFLSYEFGRAISDAQGHDPSRFPAIVTLGGRERSSLLGLVGKTITRGFVANVGDNPAVVQFWKNNDPQPSAPLVLVPGQTVDFSWFFDEISVDELSPGDAVSVQVLAQ